MFKLTGVFRKAKRETNDVETTGANFISIESTRIVPSDEIRLTIQERRHKDIANSSKCKGKDREYRSNR